MGEIAIVLLTAIWVSLVTALLLFLLKIWWERSAVKTAILTDMDNILRRARETYEYLQSDTHYWLQPGDVLSRAPMDVATQTVAYQSLLPKLHLLGPTVFARVLAFYSHYLYCDGLKAVLFSRIKEHVTCHDALTATDVSVLRLRRQRICSGLQSIFEAEDAIATRSLRRLPNGYAIPSTREIAAKIDTALVNDQRRILLL